MYVYLTALLVEGVSISGCGLRGPCRKCECKQDRRSDLQTKRGFLGVAERLVDNEVIGGIVRRFRSRAADDLVRRRVLSIRGSWSGAWNANRVTTTKATRAIGIDEDRREQRANGCGQ